MSQLGGGTERVGGGDDDTEGQEGEIEHGHVYGRRGEDECHVALFEWCEGLEGGGEGFCAAEEERVGEVVVGGGVDEGGGGGGREEREGVFGCRDGVGGRREGDVWAQAVEGSGMWAETAVWVDGGVRVCLVVGHCWRSFCKKCCGASVFVFFGFSTSESVRQHYSFFLSSLFQTSEYNKISD